MQKQLFTSNNILMLSRGVFKECIFGIDCENTNMKLKKTIFKIQ